MVNTYCHDIHGASDLIGGCMHKLGAKGSRGIVRVRLGR
jgi:hypothetical protein